MIKGSILQEDKIVVNTHTSNIGVSKHIKQILIDPKKEVGKNIIIVGNINIPLSAMGRPYKQEINKETWTSMIH